jgi:pimeloyl-ACP methyl ester carboxylesterase
MESLCRRRRFYALAALRELSVPPPGRYPAAEPEIFLSEKRTPETFFRQAGTGPGVVCLHSNASSSAQWRGLLELLAPKFRVFAPDAYDSGKGPHWPSDRVIRLQDEAALFEPVLARAGAPLALVGHSHGAAVALIAALANPARVRAMALYEPTLFSLIEADQPAPNDADGIRDAVAASSAALDAGDQDAAARHFIDYWMGAGAWQQTPEARKPPIAASVTNVRRWAHALMTEPTPLQAFRALEMPVLYMVGKRSTASAHGVARLLAAALPRVELVEFEKLGHMGPVTHPEQVNEAIRQFLEKSFLEKS